MHCALSRGHSWNCGATFHVRPAILFFSAAILLMLRVALAIDPLPQTMTTEAIRAEAKRLEKEIGLLDDSAEAPETWKQAVELRKKLNQFLIDRLNEENKLKWEITNLARASDYQAWDGRIKLLSERLNALRRESFAREKGINRAAFEARHAELTKLVATEICFGGT